jgi:hypothetical protein
MMACLNHSASLEAASEFGTPWLRQFHAWICENEKFPRGGDPTGRDLKIHLDAIARESMTLSHSKTFFVCLCHWFTFLQAGESAI